jgi:hypothetical protein
VNDILRRRHIIRFYPDGRLDQINQKQFESEPRGSEERQRQEVAARSVLWRLAAIAESVIIILHPKFPLFFPRIYHKQFRLFRHNKIFFTTAGRKITIFNFDDVFCCKS